MPPAAKKPAKKKPATKKPAVKKASAKKPAAKKPAAKKPAAKKPAAKKAAAKKPAAKKPAAKKAAAKKPAKPAVKKPAAAKAPAAKRAVATKKPVRTASSSSTDYKNFEPYQPRRGERYMNDKQRDHFRAILRDWRRELMQEVDRTVTHMKDEAANFPDPADRATQEEEFSLELRTRDRERKLIKKIDATLELIDQDDYGYCDACGVEIGIQRLEARPTATMCIDCKTLAEIKEKQELG